MAPKCQRLLKVANRIEDKRRRLTVLCDLVEMVEGRADAEKGRADAEKVLRDKCEAQIVELTVELAQNKAVFVVRPLIEYGLRHYQLDNDIDQSLSMTKLSEVFLSKKVFESSSSWELQQWCKQVLAKLPGNVRDTERLRELLWGIYSAVCAPHHDLPHNDDHEGEAAGFHLYVNKPRLRSAIVLVICALQRAGALDEHVHFTLHVGEDRWFLRDGKVFK
jgi:hypothetical protein